ncbi:S1/P1 nuclease [Flavobacterium sp. RSB2_4_14]|uniref:S1/P1 nuclease n=1 Tax=Flavobacterium sp. RSB2_4_14 TaxID=3447665 RepID=UPI003F3244F6
MKKYITAVLITTAFLAPNNSFAWSEKGHALVAQVALNYLDANTKKIVNQYLDGMTFEEAANWMDDIKSDKKYDYMRKLHYINADRGQSIVPNNEENIIGAITKTIEELKNYKTLSKEDVKIKICIIFHLIGDLHQPLHVGYGEDRGGNNFQINFYGKGTNLHSFYDSGIIEYKGLTLSECLKAKKYTKEELSEVEKIDVVNWANQSRSYLKTIYNTGNRKIDDTYINNNYPIIQEQILKAGIRLSSVLEEIFK